MNHSELQNEVMRYSLPPYTLKLSHVLFVKNFCQPYFMFQVTDFFLISVYP